VSNASRDGGYIYTIWRSARYNAELAGEPILPVRKEKHKALNFCSGSIETGLVFANEMSNFYKDQYFSHPNQVP
jgi:hypothetical protein